MKRPWIIVRSYGVFFLTIWWLLILTVFKLHLHMEVQISIAETAHYTGVNPSSIFYARKETKYYIRSTDRRIFNGWQDLTFPLQNQASDGVCTLYHPNQTIDIVIVIISRPSEKNYRDVIRETWCSRSKLNTANVRCAFLMGNNVWGNITTDSVLMREANAHRDIIFGEFTENYKNCTLKVIMGFRWVEKHCSHAKFVLKADVDIWLDVPTLLKVLQKRNFTNVLAGDCRTDITRRVGRWAVSKKEYPHASYGMVCTGPAYFMSESSMRGIIGILNEVPFLWIEDVYLSLCAQKLKMEIQNLPWKNKRKINTCSYKSGDIIMADLRNIPKVKQIWNSKC